MYLTENGLLSGEQVFHNHQNKDRAHRFIGQQRVHVRALLPERDWTEWLDRDDARLPPVHLLRL